jgi:hypothetical protein
MMNALVYHRGEHAPRSTDPPKYLETHSWFLILRPGNYVVFHKPTGTTTRVLRLTAEFTDVILSPARFF